MHKGNPSIDSTYTRNYIEGIEVPQLTFQKYINILKYLLNTFLIFATLLGKVLTVGEKQKK